MPSPPDTSPFSLGAMWWSARHPPADPFTSFAGKTVLITGANAGLGLEAATKFAALGAARLILGVRSIARGEAAKAEICRRASYAPDQITLLPLDMADFASVRTFAAAADGADAAVLNAGIAAPAHQLSAHGFEMELQVNALSTALLAALLLPGLRAAAARSGQPAHLEVVGSVAQHGVTAEMLAGAKGSVLRHVSERAFFDVQRQYQVTKLFAMYAVQGLAAACPAHEVVVVAACPSLCRTTLGRDFPSVLNLLNSLFQLVFARTAEQGSRTLVSGAALGGAAHGEFWSHDVLFRKGEMVTSDEGREMQRRVWGEMRELLVENGVPEGDLS